MTQPREAITTLLQAALDGQTPVIIERNHDWWAADVRGFVVGLTKRWVVVQALSDAIYADGVQMIRRKHVTDVIDNSERGYIARAAAALGRSEVGLSVPADARTPDVLRVASAHSPLVGVFIEKKDEDARLIGHITAYGDKTFDMQLIGPKGEWTTTSSRHKYKHVTRIEVGDRYSGGLSRFGDPRPECEGHSDEDPCSC